MNVHAEIHCLSMLILVPMTTTRSTKSSSQHWRRTHCLRLLVAENALLINTFADRFTQRLNLFSVTCAEFVIDFLICESIPLEIHI